MQSLGTLDVGGESVVTGNLSSDDPWGAARLLIELANADAIDPRLREVAMSFRTREKTDIGTARALHAYVRDHVQFVREPVETFQAAYYTLFTVGAGDCDDSARALFALARQAGLRARLRFLVQGGAPAHVYCEIAVGPRWYPAETTVKAAFGEAPADAAKRLGIRMRMDLGGRPVPAPSIEGLGVTADAITVDPGTRARLVFEFTKPFLGGAPGQYVRDMMTALGFAGVGVFLQAGDVPATWSAGARGVTATFPSWIAWAEGVYSGTSAMPLVRQNDHEGYILRAGEEAPKGKPAPPIVLTKHISRGFFLRLRDVAAKHALDPANLLLMLANESGLKPWAVGSNIAADGTKTPYAYGLNQLNAPNLKALGWTGTPADFVKLSAEEQVPFVDGYYKWFDGKHVGDSLARMYQANFVPATLDDGPSTPDRVLVRKDGTRWNGAETAFYRSNAGLDHGKKGYITVGDLDIAARGVAGVAVVKEALARLAADDPGDAPVAPAWTKVVAGVVGVGAVALALGVAVAYARS